MKTSTNAFFPFQPKSSESLQAGISPTPNKRVEDVVAHNGDVVAPLGGNEVARMAESSALSPDGPEPEIFSLKI